jgi:hypothetical protein
MVSERMKMLGFNNQLVNTYFWRTTQQQEIDYIEEKDGRFATFEFKLNPKQQGRLSKTFKEAYKDHTFRNITPDNYFEFLV